MKKTSRRFNVAQARKLAQALGYPSWVRVSPTPLSMDKFVVWNTKMLKSMTKQERKAMEEHKKHKFDNFQPFRIHP